MAGLAAELAVFGVEEAWEVAGLAAEPALFAGVDAAGVAGFLAGGALDGVLAAGFAGVDDFAGVAVFAGVEPAAFGVDLAADAGALAAGAFLGVSLSTILICWTLSVGTGISCCSNYECPMLSTITRVA